jgi:Phytanoyl-CoA dioxygenase (PhyH)
MLLETLPNLNIPWINSPFFDKLLEFSALDEETKKLVKHYADYGYVIVDTELQDFDNIANTIICNLSDKYQGNLRIQDAWTFDADVRKISLNPKILSLLRIFYQREPIPFQTLNFPVGTQQSTHSDTIHFHSVPAEFMCGVWVALEDVDGDNGPLHYYPKSHKLPIFDLNHLGLTATGSKQVSENYAAYEKFLQILIQNLGLEKVDISVRKGQALIWSANLLHGGSPILDPSRTRHSQVTHYFFSDCIYYTPLLSDPFLKKIYIREIRNIATGEVVPHFYNGEKINYEELVQQEFLTNHLEQLKSQLKTMKKALEQTNNSITSMSNSKFWKLHNAWMNLKQFLGVKT